MTSVLSNRRMHLRKDLGVQVFCHLTDTVRFPGLKQLVESKWTCINLGQGGMLLEVREAPEGGQVGGMFRGKGSNVYYPALPPEKLKMAIELKFPRRQNSFLFHGSLTWFRHVSKGVYRMGVTFDEGQEFHIYQDKEGKLVIATLWRESDL
jgi:hypothetical protein